MDTVLELNLPNIFPYFDHNENKFILARVSQSWQAQALYNCRSTGKSNRIVLAEFTCNVIQKDNLELLQWIHAEYKPRLSYTLLRDAIENNSVPILDWLYDDKNGTIPPLPTRFRLPPYTLVELIVKSKQWDLLEWFHTHDPVAMDDHFYPEIVSEAHHKNVDISTITCLQSAISKHNYSLPLYRMRINGFQPKWLQFRDDD